MTGNSVSKREPVVSFRESGVFYERFPHVNLRFPLVNRWFPDREIFKIGDYVVFSPNVKLLSAGHDYRLLNLPHTYGKITIGDRVWIGEGSIILQGVTIGTGAVIGAGSVVSKDVEPWTVAVGNPARMIKNRDVIS